MKNSTPLLALKGITKKFGSFTANDAIDFDVCAGDIHALLGENGAGKSTLMNIAYGIYRADAGEIRVQGRLADIATPRDALANGIGMVHQHFMLVGSFSALDNIFLIGRDSPLALRSRKKTEARLRTLMEQFHIEVDLYSPVEQLGIAAQQKIEILKLLYTGADVLVFDEPTAVLPPQECDSLFAIMRRLAGEGKGIIFISHKLEEVLSVSNRITVLSQGRVCGTLETAQADKKKIVRMMVGEELEMPALCREHRVQGEKLLTAEELCASDNRGVRTLRGVSLSVRAGEIVGVAGVDGNGQSELAEVLAGVRRADGGRVFFEGDELDTRSARDFIDKRIAYIPADRNAVGAVSSFPLYENWILRNDCPTKRGGLIDYGEVCAETERAMAQYDVRARNLNERTANLSGGNLQKFIIARSLNASPRVLICSYPTRGLDIKASNFIRGKILEARGGGAGVLLLSGDFEELFALCDRILVLFKGSVAGEVAADDASVRKLGMLMMGVTQYGA